jgi:hypothetical protein
MTLRTLSHISSVLLMISACTRESEETKVESKRSELKVSTLNHTEQSVGIRFPVAEGVQVKAEHFNDPTLEPYKFRHEINLWGSDGIAVMIHVWNNPEHQSLSEWFHENLQFMIDEQTKISEEPMTLSREAGILLDQPASEQAPSMAVAVFAHGDQFFRITCIDYDGVGGPEARKMFFTALDGMELGVTP